MTVELKLGTLTRQVGPTQPRIMIGRDEQSCELWIHDESVSRRHAEVFLQGNSVFIRDLGSSNGTWVNGQALGAQPVELAPGQVVYVGHAPLGVEWTQPGGGRAATVMAALPPELMAMMAQRRQQQLGQSAPPTGYPGQPTGYPGQPTGYGQAPGQPMGFAQPQQARPQTAAPGGSPAAHQAQQSLTNMGAGVAATVGVGGTQGPTPSELTYRSQGSNNNGTLLIALPGDTFANDNTINGFLEFTSTDKETVASIFVELVEYHKKGPKNGHVWDRCLARQGPWKTKKGDVLPMPFSLRVPSGTSISSPDCYWRLRGYVDISWAFDIEANIDITMRNRDIEKIRDALGALDYRINNIASKPLGQKYTGKFNPPMHLRKQLNITDINLDIEYLGTNLKVMMEVEKNKLFHFDKKQEFVFALDMLRNASLADVSAHFQTEINKLMS
ncbi:MAG: FHA domain-containing protein [Enhygromyxa sp.]